MNLYFDILSVKSDLSDLLKYLMYLFCGFYSAEIVQDSDEGGALNECTVNFDQSLPTRHQVSISLHSFNPNISMQFLHTFLPTFPKLSPRGICSVIMRCFSQ